MNDISLLAQAFHTVKLQQQMLVKAIFPASNKNVKMDKDIQSSLGFDTRGITIYRHSLQANARQALAVSYPTVVQLIGDDLFNHCCRKLLSLSPPCQGDWGVWGADFAKLLEMQPELETYPFVSDLAKLDWLRHNSMRANDSVFDSGSLVLLTSAHLDELYIDFSESCYLMTSSFPVIEFWLAHQKTHDVGDDEELAKQYLTQALKKLAKTDFTQHICINRANLIAHPRELSDDEYLWLTHLMAGKSIGHALDDMPEGIFDFAQWLGQAIELNLIKGIK